MRMAYQVIVVRQDMELVEMEAIFVNKQPYTYFKSAIASDNYENRENSDKHRNFRRILARVRKDPQFA